MNSTSRRDHHDGSSVAASERKRFFKPILKDTLREGKLDLKHAGDDTVCSEELKHAGEEQYPEVGCKARERSPLPFPFPNKKARNDSTVHRNSTSMSVPHSRPKQLTREVPHEVEGSGRRQQRTSTGKNNSNGGSSQRPTMKEEPL
ncbi:hypothetical protein HS088_TW01G00851 [Tripterygium wilfordii]|uniref:Uncharacterized protein n=1 Tax=Tripterygium wilfordii TaxID=458696 RepID=A0A7J7E321_TRIWF|nr:hypothetical protein HS088_TW01G00851 [Tripterygium wilfordii]